jgi:hypothetical protein
LAGSGPYVQIYTWKTGQREVLATRAGAVYDPVTKRPAFSWTGYRATSSRTREVNNFVTFAGLLDENRPLFWQSGLGSHGILASSLGWFDVAKRGTGSSGLILFERKHYDFIALDAARRLVVVRDHVVGGRFRAFRLGTRYSDTREVPLTRPHRRFTQIGKGSGVVSSDWNWMVVNGKEHDLKKGRETPIPATSNRPRYFTYAGSDLFFAQEVLAKTAEGDPKRNSIGDALKTSELWRWNRESRKSQRIGAFDLVGKSPNGRFIVVRSTSPTSGSDLWMIDRNR